MATIKGRTSAFLLLAFCALTSVHAGQGLHVSDEEFGPVVRAYLGYLKNEQEVVDDRASRREVSASFFCNNSTSTETYPQTPLRALPNCRAAGNARIGSVSG